MAGLPELARLQARKRELTARIESDRAALTVECDRLRGVAAAIDAGYALMHKLRAWLPLAAPVAGFLAARKWRSLSGFGAKLSYGLGLFRTARSVWESFRTRA